MCERGAVCREYSTISGVNKFLFALILAQGHCNTTDRARERAKEKQKCV